MSAKAQPHLTDWTSLEHTGVSQWTFGWGKWFKCRAIKYCVRIHFHLIWCSKKRKPSLFNFRFVKTWIGTASPNLDWSTAHIKLAENRFVSHLKWLKMNSCQPNSLFLLAARQMSIIWTLFKMYPTNCIHFKIYPGFKMSQKHPCTTQKSFDTDYTPI